MMLIPSLSKNRLTKKLAIVGSSEVKNDQSEQIDTCDLVIRFNECKVYDKNNGKKVDVLCITNTGLPALRISSGNRILNSPFYHMISEIWFPRDARTHTRHAKEDFYDESKRLVESNDLSRFTIVKFSAELNLYIFDQLKRCNMPFNCPSTGFFGIMYVLTQKRFAEYDKYLFGFEFTGYHCHAWESGKYLANIYASTREDFHIIPTA